MDAAAAADDEQAMLLCYAAQHMMNMTKYICQPPYLRWQLTDGAADFRDHRWKALAESKG